MKSQRMEKASISMTNTSSDKKDRRQMQKFPSGHEVMGPRAIISLVIVIYLQTVPKTVGPKRK